MWPAVKPGGVLLMEDILGDNPLLKWLLEGHDSANATMQGMYYLGGKVGRPDEISRQSGNILNNFNEPMSQDPTANGNIKIAHGDVSRVQAEVENLGFWFNFDIHRLFQNGLQVNEGMQPELRENHAPTPTVRLLGCRVELLFPKSNTIFCRFNTDDSLV